MNLKDIIDKEFDVRLSFKQGTSGYYSLSINDVPIGDYIDDDGEIPTEIVENFFDVLFPQASDLEEQIKKLEDQKADLQKKLERIKGESE